MGKTTEGRKMRMPLSIGKSLMIIAVVSVVTFSTRVIPFLLFPKGKEIPPLVKRSEERRVGKECDR